MKSDDYSTTYSTLKRMTEIHRRLLPPSQLPTSKSLAESFGVSSKTIQRDIKFMRDVWGVPVHYNTSLGGYEYYEGVIDFPAVKLNEEEIFAFLVTRNSIEKYQGTAIKDPLSRLYDKFVSQMGILASERMKKVQEYVSFRTAGWSTMDYETLEKISEACRDRKELTFTYNYPWRGKETKKRIHPIHLVNHDNAWYVFTTSDKKGIYPAFSLSRMEKVRVHTTTFPEEKFSLENYMKDSFGIFRGNEIHKVKVWFDAFAAPFIRERKWNESQKVKTKKDGSLEFSITVNSLVEIKGWLLNWGEHAKVLGPKELVSDMKEELKKMLKQYQ
ncbi:MAG: WYL domain-containing transcriptional regulator [Verrucomicrobia bacterium]|nr:WYL domain-containing transcriptional regulator [Verrucomicrobiota bacterium]